MDHNHENSFWRSSVRSGPGRTSPKKDAKGTSGKSSKGPVGSTSFQDFQESVRDAWDMGDDEFCILSGKTGNFLCLDRDKKKCLFLFSRHKNL